VVQTVDEAKPHRITTKPNHNWNRLGHRSCCQRRSCAAGRDNHIHLTANQIGRQCRQSVILAVRPAKFDCHIAAPDETSFAQTLVERAQIVRHFVGRSDAEKPCDRHRRLLRPCRERPRRRAAEQRDEIAASDESCHLIPPAGRATEG
jgi:hypothetical protein